jgi:V8-like Glu-specific endopeptidase
MSKTAKEFSNAIKESINDLNRTSAFCEELTGLLYNTKNEFQSLEADRILQTLRSKRYFQLMRKVGDALIRTGRGTFRVYRQFAQALIDEGDYDLAIFILNDLADRTKNSDDEQAAEENAEARGLLGRAYKDLFLKAKDPIFALDYLKKAIPYYKDVYDKNKQNNLWHGINTLTLISRAKKEGLDTEDFPDPGKLANEIINIVDNKEINRKAVAWDYASAAEACVALSKWGETTKWLEKYFSNPEADEFALFGTLRQFKVMWDLDKVPEAGNIISLLQVNLERKKELSPSTSEKKDEIKKESFNEKVFSSDKYQTSEWYETVARIGLEASVGKGTGFLLKGSDLSNKLNEDYILLTNAHVISDDPLVTDTYRTEQVCVIFEKINPGEKFAVDKVYWTSVREKFDATIVRFYEKDQKRINEIGQKSDPFPISNLPPSIGDGQRAYIIGHPNGGTLSYSLQDNLLLDFENHLIHYRTPTDKGSSGSPVFNNQWVLIGLHHSGSRIMNMLHGKSGTYEANEAIWIKAIKNQITLDCK